MADAASLQAQLNDTNRMLGALYAVTISKKKGADGELLDRSRTTDENAAAILAGVTVLLSRQPGATVTAAEIAKAIPEALAQQVVDALAARLDQ